MPQKVTQFPPLTTQKTALPIISCNLTPTVWCNGTSIKVHDNKLVENFFHSPFSIFTKTQSDVFNSSIRNPFQV
jgi:hypothetical protein